VKRALLTIFFAALLFSLAAMPWLRSLENVEERPRIEERGSTMIRPLAGTAPAKPEPGPAEIGQGEVGETDPQEMSVRFKDSSSIARAQTFEDLLDTYDSLTRSQVEDFSRRYDRAIDFHSQEELDWLASNGYPLPTEIAEASVMPLAKLREIAEGGNEKAEFLYFDRLTEELVLARERHIGTGLDPETVGESRAYMEAFVAADSFRRRIADNASPFAGIALARFYEEVLQNPYAAIAALNLSGSRGDHVAAAAADRLIQRYRVGSEARDALASYTLVLRDRDPGYYQAAPRPGPAQ
jgi:hypothetical protein